MGRAVDNRSVYLYGMHPLLVLADGSGYEAIIKALLPRPQAAESMARRQTYGRDPFSDPDRPLTFTLASDLAASSARQLRQMLDLSRLRHIQVDAIPPVEVEGWDAAGRVAFKKVERGIEITTTRHPDQVYWDWYGDPHSDDVAPLLAQQTGLSSQVAAELALDLAIHKALGNDYLVSPVLAAYRATAPFWGEREGTCTIEEALFLAGLKSRLYRTAPLHVDARISFWTTTGSVYDGAAMDLSRPLRSALAGSLSPTASHEESQCIDHLIAIRSRLRDLLVYRDELGRLERREVLGKDWPRAVERDGSVSGGTGNDLVFRVDYHVTAALNAFTTILDNLAWVVSARERLSVTNARAVGFDRLIEATKPFGQTKASATLAKHVTADALLQQGLALRVLRNIVDHRTGFSYGWVMSVRDQTWQGPEMLSVWIPRDEPRFGMPDGTERPAAEALEDLATVAIPELLILRPRVLVEACVASASAVVSLILRLYPWQSRAWLYQDPQYRQREWTQHHHRGRWHRGLWGTELIRAGRTRP
jgi:hypothetical protein